MIIDRDLPRVLMARGMTRRQVAACLRQLDEHSGSTLSGGAGAMVSEALATTSLFRGTLSGFSFEYDIAIGKGVRLEYGSDPAKGSRVVIDGEIPTVLQTILTGRRLGDLVDHALLPVERTIRRIVTQDGVTVVDIQRDAVEHAIAAPATQRDMEIVRLMWRYRRKRDAWRAGAVRGLTIRDTIKALAAGAAVTAGAIVLGRMTGTGGTWSMATIGFAIIATWLMVRMADEDSGLSELVDELRIGRINGRRAAILAGDQAPSGEPH